MIVVSVSTIQKGDIAKHIDRMLKAANGPKNVKVGLPAGKSSPGVIDIAFWNHFGTGGSQTGFVRNGIGGFGGPIPPRPFIAVAMWRSRGEIRASMRKAAQSMIRGDYDMRMALERLGMLGASRIRQTITFGGGFAPNAPLTIKIKGSSRPLVDNGRMAGAITWQVV